MCGRSAVRVAGEDFCVEGWRPLEDGQPGGGQGAGVDVLGVSGSVQGRLRGTAVDLGQGVLQQLDGGQDLKQDPFVRERKRWAEIRTSAPLVMSHCLVTSVKQVTAAKGSRKLRAHVQSWDGNGMKSPF